MKGSPGAYYWTWFLPLKVLGITFSWGLSLGLIYLAIKYDHMIIASILGGMQIIGFNLFIVCLPFRLKHTYQIKKGILKLIDIKNIISKKTWSPNYLMQKIEAINERFLMPELIPLIAKMIKRDADIFNFQ